MMKYLTIATVTAALLITACGGSGSDSGSTDTAAPSAPVVSDTDPGMNELTVDNDFDFTTDVTVTVEVAANVVNQRAYLNVCQAEAEVTSDETCFFRSPLTAEGLSSQLVIPHNEQKLRAEIWYYDVNAEPKTFYWQFDNTIETQTFLIQ